VYLKDILRDDEVHWMLGLAVSSTTVTNLIPYLNAHTSTILNSSNFSNFKRLILQMDYPCVTQVPGNVAEIIALC